LTFKGKVAVVTGAASGIGRALAVGFAKRGSDVAICDVNEVGLEETRHEVERLGRKVFSQRLDVADREAFHRFADAVIAHYGRVDFVVNNAGVAVAETVLESTYEDWEWIMGINFWGVVHGTKAFLPHMVERNSGSIVNVSSIFGIIAVPTQGLYNATKFAVRGMTEALRHELEGTGVHVACVHPGGINTNIVRNARYHKGPDGTRDKEASVERFKKIARTTPAQAAETILRGIERREPRILIGTDAKILDGIQRSAPVRYWSLFGAISKVLER
jgi:NAD(P)-dependent dehydrogenase (short-subunit alcohol dehydrogenase family)